MRIAYWSILSIAWIILLARPLGKVPALGPLLEVRRGVWHHEPFQWRDHAIAGLKKSVHVAIDANGVPHFFAQNEEDLYLAQGYAVASQRLFQIEVTTRSMSGNLSELIGEKGLKHDRFFTKFGMRQAEKALHQEMMKDSRTHMMAEQYVAGINAFVRQLDDAPVEFKLLGRTPAEMDTHILSRMAKTMTFSLSGGSPDLLQSHLRLTMPVEKVLDLFPEFLPPEYEDFVYPGPGGVKPRAPETPAQFGFQSHFKNFPDIPRPPNFNGSNNWVVGPQKSSTGHSILANDTHLGLSLPNVWYENQLSCPEFNVYGVSFPAVPGIVNGFNRDIAWGPTNGSTDAIDYFEVEFSDDTGTLYKDGSTWTQATVEHELVAGEDIPVMWTKWGPVLYREGHYGLVVLWTGRQASNELSVLRGLYARKTAKDCLAAFNGWKVPIQNFVCADADHFGMVHAGWIAERSIGEGRFIGSPETSRSALSERVPISDQPQAYDPPEGFLRSANERTMGPRYPHYMGSSYEEPFRGRAIRRLLEAKAKFSGADMIAIQSDSYSTEAEMILPVLLKVLPAANLSAEQKARLQDLANWDLRARAGGVEASLYKQWYQELKTAIFADDIALPERPGYAPKDMRVAWMLKRVAANPNDSDAEWIDDKRTPQRESLSDIVLRSFQMAWDQLSSTLGKDSSKWTWNRWVNTEIPHMARIPGFGTKTLDMDGSSDSVRGNRGWHGAVYRFVIELGAQPRAWMQVPGGNSGDPFARDFERFTNEWARGEMRPVEFYADLEEARRHAQKVIELTPEGAK